MPAPVLRPPVYVHSYAPGRAYPLSAWEIIDVPGGFATAVFVNGEMIGFDEIQTVREGDVDFFALIGGGLTR